jgi:hypothetical protein
MSQLVARMRRAGTSEADKIPRSDLRPPDERLGRKSRPAPSWKEPNEARPLPGSRGAVQSQTWMRGLYQIPRYPSQTGAPRVQ